MLWHIRSCFFGSHSLCICSHRGSHTGNSSIFKDFLNSSGWAWSNTSVVVNIISWAVGAKSFGSFSCDNVHDSERIKLVGRLNSHFEVIWDGADKIDVFDSVKGYFAETKQFIWGFIKRVADILTCWSWEFGFHQRSSIGSERGSYWGESNVTDPETCDFGGWTNHDLDTQIGLLQVAWIYCNLDTIWFQHITIDESSDDWFIVGSESLLNLSSDDRIVIFKSDITGTEMA